MVYVKRNASGRIIAASLEEAEGYDEALAADAPDLASFSGAITGGNGMLAISDLPMVRVLEDLIDLLVTRGVIRFTDFPDVAQQKMLERRSMREGIQGLKLFGDDQEKVI